MSRPSSNKLDRVESSGSQMQYANFTASFCPQVNGRRKIISQKMQSVSGSTYSCTALASFGSGSQGEVERKTNFYFNDHNERIPRPLFKGATPKEKFLNLWTELDARKLKEGLERAKENRKKTLRRKTCSACEDTRGSPGAKPDKTMKEERFGKTKRLSNAKLSL